MTCEKHVFKRCKTLWKNVFFEAILKLCSSSLCIWFYVFAPGSHCFAIDILNNRSAICTIHFRSIWTAPLRFSTCRSWAGSKVTAAKLDPKKSKFHLPNWMFKCVFAHFLHFSRFYQMHFQNVFHIFSKRIFKCIFHILWKMWKMRTKCVLKTGLEKVKNAFWKCEKNASKMWKHVKKREQKAVEKFLFLSPMFPMCFSRYRFFFKFSLKSNFKL